MDCGADESLLNSGSDLERIPESVHQSVVSAATLRLLGFT